jgi:hypothetical protein
MEGLEAEELLKNDRHKQKFSLLSAFSSFRIPRVATVSPKADLPPTKCPLILPMILRIF